VVMALPVVALAGWALLIWRAYKLGAEGRDLLHRTLAVALPAIVAFGLLFWQMRAAPAAQLLALPAATALIVLVAAKWIDSPRRWLHGAAIVVILLAFGAAVPVALKLIPEKKKTVQAGAVSQANTRCPSFAALAPIQKQPRGMVFTFIDLGPRLIVATHHDAVGGPYHRNDKSIADVMLAFRGSEARAHRIIREYRSDYLLICPNMSTATIFMAEAPNGFYGQLTKGKVPPWLQPVQLPADSPFKLWKVVG